MNFVPYHYQEFAGEHLWKHPFSGLFIYMGMGKTVISLTYINRIIYQECMFTKALIIAPKRVARTVWKQEAAKWDHLKHLKVSIVWGTEKQRIAALKEPADVYVTNRENVDWLVRYMQSGFNFDLVLIDESSSFKSHKSKRFKALQSVRKYIKRLHILTGTPAPNSLMDLWAQIYLLDMGERLERNIGAYRERYFSPDKTQGYIVFSYRARKDSQQAIYKKIEDICISMKSEDYLELPRIIENDIELQMDDEMQAKYDQFEEESVMELADKEVTALNAAALATKLMQFANGAVYHEDKTYTILHDEKLNELEEIIEEQQGNPILVFYSYKHDLDRIMKRFPYARKLNTEKDINEWNNGEIPLMVAHPASAGHGLNLQKGGRIMVWFGLTYSLELYLQALARLQRIGQEYPVIVYRLIMGNTIDEDIVKALARKKEGQNALLDAIKAKIEKYKHARKV